MTWSKSIEHVQQECPSSCVVACIAMVAGVSFDRVRELVQQPDLDFNITCRILAHFGIWPRIPHCPTLQDDSLYLVRTPSLNKPGGMHGIVIDTRGDGFTVLDPNKGRDGAKFYDEKSLTNWGDPIECIYSGFSPARAAITALGVEIEG